MNKNSAIETLKQALDATNSELAMSKTRLERLYGAIQEVAIDIETYEERIFEIEEALEILENSNASED